MWKYYSKNMLLSPTKPTTLNPPTVGKVWWRPPVDGKLKDGSATRPGSIWYSIEDVFDMFWMGAFWILDAVWAVFFGSL